MFLHHLLGCSTYPGQPGWSQGAARSHPRPSAGMTGTSPGSFQRLGITGVRVCRLPRGRTGGWHKAGIAGSVPRAHPCLPGGPGMGCWSCPWRGFVLNCSNPDQEWPAEGFRGAALLGGGCGSEQSSWRWEEKLQPRGIETTLPQWKENGQGEAQGHFDGQESGTAIK